ncbi:PAS domain S-box protein [bacterium]|nr:PAS domain S-box protein [bacterium]
MTLRKKTLLLLGAMVLFILLSLYSTSQLIFRYNYEKIEARTTKSNLERVKTGIAEELNRLHSETESLAASALIADFFNQDQNPASYAITTQKLLTLHDLDLIAVIDSGGSIVQGMLYNPNLDLLSEVPPDIQSHLSTGGLLVNQGIADSSISGIIRLPDGPMLVISSQVELSDSTGGAQGRLIFGCYFDEAMIRKMALETRLWVNFHFIGEENLPRDIQIAVKSLLEDSPTDSVYVQSLGDHTVSAYTLLSDIYGQPIIIVRVEVPREVYREGISQAKYFTFAMLIFAFVLGAIIPWILEKLIFSRLSRLHEEIKSISDRQDLSGRLSLSGRDELTGLISEINKMLKSLEGNETKLQDYSQRLEVLVSQKMNELQVSEEMLRSIILYSPAAIFLTNTNGIIIDCNQAALALTRRRRMKDLMTKPLAKILNLEESTYFAKGWERLAQQGSLRNEEYEICFDGEEIVYTEFCASEIRDHNNNPTNYVVIIRDISERMLYIKALELSEHRYKQLFDRNLAGVFSLSLEGVFLDCNESFKNILGIESKDQIIGTKVDRYYKKPITGSAFISLVRQYGIVSNLEHQFERPDGDTIWVLENASLVQTGDFEEPYVLATVFDITDAKLTQQREREMELELMQQSKLASVGLLSAGIAHNLNVPLHAIMSQIEMMQLTGNDSSYLDDMMKQVQLMSDISDNILKKTRNEQNQEKKDIDINELLREELKFLNADLVFKHSITKDFEFDPDLPRVRGVYSDFSQAIMNCVKNAIDAIHHTEVKLLSVRTRACEDNEILIEIEDSGSGIPKEIQDRIFKPFFTTKPLAGEQQEGEPFGTGLGLSSSLNLIEKYNGRIEIDSKMDEGTTMRIYIPTACVGENYKMKLETEALEEEIISS